MPETTQELKSVKIEADVHKDAKKIAAFTGQRVRDVVNDALRETLPRKLRQAIEAVVP